MANKKTGIIFVLAVIINFAKHGRSQCLEKLHRNARCHNIAIQLHGAQKSINVLKKCFIAECNNTPGTNMKKCMRPERNITGFNALSIDKTLTIEDFLQDILNRTEIHLYHNKENRKHLKTKCDQKMINKVKIQMVLIKDWIKRTQQNLGFTTIQSTLPSAMTKAKSTKDWYYIQIQMLVNLNKDFGDMSKYFQSKRSCIIPAC